MHKKYRVLLVSILLDIIGMLTFLFPGIGEIGDVFWAPLSAYILYKMYKGIEGKVGSIISFIEEAGILGSDFVPTFTLMWLYKYVYQKED